MKKLFWVFVLCLFVPFCFVGCGNPNKDLLSTPKEVAVAADGIVKFQRIENDEYYVIKINDLEQNVFVNNQNPYMELFNSNGVNYLQYDISRMLVLGESYSIQVKACASKKKDSEFSAPISYVHQVHIETPNTKITGTTLTWDNVLNANIYTVKVVTPSTIIAADDPDTVANATNVFSSQYSLNKFEFSSMLTEAGEYKFYVKAISRENNYLESDFSAKVVYENIIKLAEPQNLHLHKVANDWILSCLVDENTNNLKLDFNGEIETIDINALCVETDPVCENLIYINLNQAFKNKNIDFGSVSYAELTCQAVFETQGKNYYVNSAWATPTSLKITNKVSAPVVQLNQSNNVLSWQVESTDSISGFKVYVCMPDEVQTFLLTKDIFSFELPEGFISASVQTMGYGEKANSELGNFVSNSSSNGENLNIRIENDNITWNQVEGAYYLAETNNEVLVVNTNSLSLLTFGYYVEQVNVTAVVTGKKHNTATLKPNYSIKLLTPTNVGFFGSNKFLLSFDKVENAIGYKVYVTDLSNSSNQAICIPKIFYATSIDLTSMLSSGKEYRVQVQAVADKFDKFVSSNLSSPSLTLTYNQVLDTPEMIKDEHGSPIIITKSADKNLYSIKFNGVEGANRYEIKVDFQIITVYNDNRTTPYTVDITEYLTDINGEAKAGVHDISVRALPEDLDKVTQASKPSKYEYKLRKQLKQVANISVSDPNLTDGQFILSFDLQENAKNYSVEITKLNDTEYYNYLATLNLTLPITEVVGSINITKYLQQAGEYYIYMTAHPADKDYYDSSDRSSNFAIVSKLESLTTPYNILHANQSNSEFLIRWTGDQHADSYTVKVVAPQNKEYVYKTTQTSFNINDSLTVEGDYRIFIKSVVAANSESSKTYISSSFSAQYDLIYRYTEQKDFERFGVYLFDDSTIYDYNINNVTELTNLLWYHLLHGVDENYKLNIFIPSKTEDETTKQAILRLADEASNYVSVSGNTSIYDFSADGNWLNLVNGANTTNANLLEYISKKLLEAYPEMAILQNFSCQMVNDRIYRLDFSNALDGEKVENLNYRTIAKDYANQYVYIDKSLRRNTNSVFAIDSCKSMEVSTTEQLFMAVQYGFKPVFVGNSQTAERVYQNARLVLSAIASANMSNLEKVSAIFDWLEFAYNINMDAKTITVGINNVEGELKDWGNRAEFYLEGLLYNIGQSTNGEIVIGSTQATSESLSKAFVLLCGIEGIEARKVNGNLLYRGAGETAATNHAHSWNKVKLATDEESEANWYNVDLTYSDLRYDARTKANSYNMASHLFFLVSDAYLQSNLNFGNKTNSLKVVNMEENQIVTMPQTLQIGKIEQNYDYYSNTIKTISYEKLQQVVNELYLTPNAENITTGKTQAENANSTLSLKYMSDWDYRHYLYSEYDGTISRLQAFALNMIIYGKSRLVENGTNSCTFELRVDENSSQNVGTSIISELTSNGLNKVLWKMNNMYITDQENENRKYLTVESFSSFDNASKTTTIVFTMQYQN